MFGLIILILAVSLLLTLVSAGLQWVICWALSLVGIVLPWSWELVGVFLLVFVIFTSCEFK